MTCGLRKITVTCGLREIPSLFSRSHSFYDSHVFCILSFLPLFNVSLLLPLNGSVNFRKPVESHSSFLLLWPYRVKGQGSCLSKLHQVRLSILPSHAHSPKQTIFTTKTTFLPVLTRFCLSVETFPLLSVCFQSHFLFISQYVRLQHLVSCQLIMESEVCQ